MNRLVFLALGTFFLFSLLIAQYFKIQILEGEKWTQTALAQHEMVVKEPFRRGSFYSNTTLKRGHPEKPQPLVFDVAKFHLFIDPVSIPEGQKGEIARQLATLCNEGVGRFAPEFEKQSRSRKLAMWLDRQTKEGVMRWWGPFAKEHKIPRNALYFVADYKRCYPFGQLLGQVLHTIREIKDDKTQESFPTGGLEAYFNEVLKGKLGRRKLLRSPFNALETDQVIEKPVHGADVFLTINHCIQAIAEEELEKGVIAARAKGGWAVMMDPSTGEIWALAQYPPFVPERYHDYFNDPEKIESAKVKPLTDAFELGSIMKPITMAVALRANEELIAAGKPPVFNPEERVDTSRSQFPGRGSKPLRDVSFHKAMNMYMALQKSSNVYMAQIIERVIQQMGAEWYRSVLVDLFGFSTRTGLELPGEALGLIPRIGKKHPNGALEWSLPTPFSLAIGHNMLSTSIQMVRAYAVLANGGIRPRPTIVRKIIGSDDKVLLDHTSGEWKESFPRVLSKESTREVVRGIKFSTKFGGTGHLAEISGYSEAGKTGTSEKIVNGIYSREKYISSFIGFAPANLNAEGGARFVLLVSIDEPAPVALEGGGRNYHGGRCAAPIFREIATRTLEYLGVDPDDPHGYPFGDPRYDPEKADWVKEVRELKHLYETWNRAA